MADMSAWDRLAHWTSSSLENLVGTGQGTGTVFGPPEGATWADWRNPNNWAQPGEPGGRPVEYTGGGTADTGVPLDSRWLEVNPNSDTPVPNQQVYIGPGARQPDWVSSPNAATLPAGQAAPAGPGPVGSTGTRWIDPDRTPPGTVVATGLGTPSSPTAQPWVDGGRMGIHGGDPFTEDDNMPRSYAPANWPRRDDLGPGAWRDPNADPFPARDPDNVTGINPAGKPWDPNWVPSASWDDQQGRIGGGSMRRIDYPQMKKDLQARRDMYMEMFGRGNISYQDLAREIEKIEPKMQEVLHWEAQQAWDAQQRELHAQLREKFRGWSAAQIREWVKNNPNFLGQGNPGFWNRYGKKQPGDVQYQGYEFQRYFGPNSPAFDQSPSGGTVMRDDVITEDVVVPGGGNVTGVEAPPPGGGSTRYPITTSEGFDRDERAKARVRAEIKEEEELDKAFTDAAVRDDANFIIMVEDFATDIIKGTPHHKGGKWTLDLVPEEYREDVRKEIARRKAAKKRT